MEHQQHFYPLPRDVVIVDYKVTHGSLPRFFIQCSTWRHGGHVFSALSFKPR